MTGEQMKSESAPGWPFAWIEPELRAKGELRLADGVGWLHLSWQGWQEDSHFYAKRFEEVKAERDNFESQAAEWMRAANEIEQEAIAGQRFVAERDALVEKMRACQLDAKRLEWIERKLFYRKWNGVIDSGSRFDWQVAGDFRHTTQHMVGEKFREAIDAALSTTPVKE